MTIDIEAIRKRTEAATPGPWRLMEGIKTLWVDAPEMASAICDMDVSQQLTARLNATYNGYFIAHARTDIPALLTILDARDATIRELRRALMDLLGGYLHARGDKDGYILTHIDVAHQARAALAKGE